MSERFGLDLNIIDVGWQGASPMAWASGIAATAIPIAILVNLFMLWCGMTRTVNIDIWNIWHMAFTGALGFTVSGKLWVGLLGVVVHAVVVYKLGDLWAPFISGGIGLLAGCGPDRAFSLGVEMAAVMVLMPKIVKCIMEGFVPLTESIKRILAKYFSGREFYIAIDPAVLLGDSQVVTAGLIFIPLTLLIGMIQPGNQVLPFGDLATISFFIAISVAVHEGNLFRILISGSAIMYMTLWISNQTYSWITELGKRSGTISGEYPVAAMDQGGSPITYLYIQLFERQNIVGTMVIGAIYLICMTVSVYYSRRQRAKGINE